MQRQVGLVTELVNLAVPGYARGRPYVPRADDLVSGFIALLNAEARRGVAADPVAGEALTLLAKAFHPVFVAADVRTVALVLNDLLGRYRARPYLVDDVGQPFHLHFHGDGGTVQSFGGEFATALALVVDTYGENRFGVCAANECDRVFVDLTRNGGRRYCSDSCGARAKMAAYRRRKARNS